MLLFMIFSYYGIAFGKSSGKLKGSILLLAEKKDENEKHRNDPDWE
jgi:hypothetical protein